MAEIGQSGSSTEITFYRSLAEVVDGRTHCDFGFAPTQVDHAEINGKPLNLMQKDGRSAYHISDASIDPTNPRINVTLDGAGYITDAERIERTASGVRVRFRRFPPK